MSETLQWVVGVPAAFVLGLGAMVALATDLSLRILFALGKWAWLLILIFADG